MLKLITYVAVRKLHQCQNKVLIFLPPPPTTSEKSANLFTIKLCARKTWCNHLCSACVCFKCAHTLDNICHWNARLFETIIYWFFWPKCSILLHKEVGNAVQIIEHVEILRFQPILKLLVTFVGSLFTLKPFISDFYKFRFVSKWERYWYFKLLIMLRYRLCCLICAESDK